MEKILSVFLSLITAFGLLTATKVNAADTGTSAGLVVTQSGDLNVRQSNSAASAVCTGLAKGSYVTLIKKTGDWWHVEYAANQYGYCYAAYIRTVTSTPTTVCVSSGNLNVRSGAGTSYSVVAALPKGTAVMILSTSGSWSRILYYGTKTGYVKNSYLSDNGSGQTAEDYRQISLHVPDYKQTDSRWASVQIGSSGKTIGQIGCATTGIAMMESYRTGTTVYPDAMAKKLTYSSSGSVYWPSYYTAVTDSTDYLKSIYQLLASGKPVLFGAKTSSGNQHWIVITGYNGSSTPTASGFTINDPGSSARTTLQQFLNSYPIFYKYFYY